MACKLALHNHLDELITVINSKNGTAVPDDRIFVPGQKIACVNVRSMYWPGSICVFWQRSGPRTGLETKDHIIYIRENGCRECGSVPLFYPMNIDGQNFGELTVNWVMYACPENFWEPQVCEYKPKISKEDADKIPVD
ncbi:MAG: hypothetical protein Q9190_002844 [Brigantiaea leucoxantha]